VGSTYLPRPPSYTGLLRRTGRSLQQQAGKDMPTASGRRHDAGHRKLH
jgi:hypothetical protein